MSFTSNTDNILNNMDLDISNYDLNDLLNLFKLDIQFTEQDLHKTKQWVLRTHPDKSKLPSAYFLFFKKAYNHLLSVYNFRNKSTSEREKVVDMDVISTDNKEILMNASKQKHFNKKFNTLFEKYVDRDCNKNGYGTWLTSSSNSNETSCSNRNEMNNIINSKKEHLREISLMKDVRETGGEGYDDIDGSAPNGYQSALFSKLAYDDLKKAHEESVIPVTIDDMKPIAQNVTELQFIRGQSINPETKERSNYILSEENNKEVALTSHRAYRLAQQDENARKTTRNWIGAFQQLTDS